ncbi:DUF4848 domain-containing protein [Fulvivirgaceae bacterium PWU4]|uniref:DUF4848 domain-containing protein n=1 Tax=Chryseosolibacter histidini TaxID=2782349 RepID=A0AAP2DGX5_9BACT|nr:DUF4848 domain-containing protein [Chryseosolibacter histidini]MBT1696168.1 DUF4848 domain-containing protein [Chryseosolibacter histidini]
MNPKTLTKSILLLAFVVAISCADEPNLQRTDVSPVKVRNGMLEFADKLAYNKVSQQLDAMSPDQLNEWEKSLPGFISIRSIYEKATLEEEIFLDNGGKPGEHSAFVQQHAEALAFVREDVMQPNLPPHTERHLSSFVNEKGFVKIGNSIFEYRSGSIKEIQDGDESKIAQLEKYSVSDPSQKILVITFTRIKINPKDIKIAFTGNSSCTGYTSGGGQRVKGNIDLHLAQMVTDGQLYWSAYVNIYATNQEKRLGIWSGKRTSQLYIYGSVDVGPDWGSFIVDVGTGGDLQTTLSTSYSFPYRLAANASNPYMSGTMTYYGRDGSSCSI